MRKLVLLFVVEVLCGATVSFAQDKEVFWPEVFWGSQGSFGTLLISPKEILVIDSKGDKKDKISAKEPTYAAYISTDGKKVVYLGKTGVWVYKLSTSENYLVTSGHCNSFQWIGDGGGMVFTIVGNTDSNEVPQMANVKLYWADGDGKNLKQVYP